MRSKTMMKTKLHRFRALALSALLLLSLLPITNALADGDGAIHIKTEEELRSFARSCTLDSWSRGKKVVLDNDLVLESADALPIPTFGGTFDGGGHTISGLAIDDSISPAGLFGVVQKSGVVKNLHIEGTVAPSGDSQNLGGIAGENHGTIESCTFNGSVSGKRNIGGIAGQNAATGVIRSCEAAGAIFGQNMTGGLVGCNLGAVVSSKNRTYVNIESTDPAIDLGDLSLEFSLDLSKVSQLDTVSISTDTGGFIYSNVTAATHRAAAELMDAGIDYRRVNKLFFQTKSRVRMQLEAAMLADAKFYDGSRVAVLAVPRALLEKFHATESDAEDLSALGPQIQGVDCAVTMRELGDGVWKFSLRTGERVNATEVCRLLGGGGHARAAGATVEHVTQAEAEEKMLSAIAQIVPDFKK